jgi:hypothetical protein
MPEPSERLDGPEPGRPRLVDPVNSGVVKLLTLLGLGGPVLVFFWTLYHYSVNVVVRDQLSDMPFINASYHHLIPWGALWSQYNEDRSFFPNLVAVVLAHTTHFNVRVEEFVGGLLLVAGIFLLLGAHHRRSPTTPWLYYSPIVLVGCSLAQYDTMLLGGVSWYLVLFCLALAIFVVDRFELTWVALGGAAVVATVGTYSSFDGLLIWPAVFVLLLFRRRRPAVLVAWVATGAVAAFFYFLGLNTSAGATSPSYAWRHPLGAIKFFVFAVGDVLGIGVKSGGGDPSVLVFGAIIVALAIALVVLYARRGADQGGGPVGIALIAFGFLFVASLVEGRGPFGYWGASASRYTTYDSLILVGVYLAMLSAAPVSFGSWIDGTRARAAMRLARWSVVALMAIQVVFGFQNGIAGAKATHAVQMGAVQVTRTVDRSPDNFVRFFVGGAWQQVGFLRQQIHIERKLHLSAFSDGR